jgi:hypothetical protein
LNAARGDEWGGKNALRSNRRNEVCAANCRRFCGGDFGACDLAKAQNCPSQPPTQTLKIFNDSDQYIFPELETDLGTPDVWIQAICQVPNSKTGTLNYGRDKTFRFYINPEGGIAPGQSVWITIPLFTQLVATVDPTQNDQYAEWWQGENIQIFSSPTSTPPRAFAEDYDSTSRKNQTPLTSPVANATFPSCSGCQLRFFSDTDGTLPKNGPSQLFEATLGARQAQPVVNDSPPNSLDVTNADFDVSYVNVAYMAGAMGPYQNDQVGYVGSPMQPVQPPGASSQFSTSSRRTSVGRASWSPIPTARPNAFRNCPRRSSYWRD